MPSFECVVLSFCDIKSAKISLLYNDKKIIKFAIVFANSFLVTNITEKEEQDGISWATFIWNVFSDFRL